jgi:hypothetical protein
MKIAFKIVSFLLLMFFASCDPIDDPDNNGNPADSLFLKEQIVSESFKGVGAQIGGYDNLNQVIQSQTLSVSDWNQLFSRLSFMRPGMVRLTGSEGWNYSLGGQFNPEKSKDILFKILDYCELNDIEVVWGEWGHVGGSSTYDQEWLSRSVNFLEYLVNTKGYTCVKYFTMVNEPNGEWSTTGGNYNLWKSIFIKTYEFMMKKGIHTKVKLMAPDIAVSSGAFTGSTAVNHPWVVNSAKELNNIIGAYDAHFYPGNNQVENDKFLKTSEAYRKPVPNDKDFIITELGFKYLIDSPKGMLNEQLKNADPYADVSANMMVYESIYGIDMSAAIIQLMIAGYKGALVWRLDDAMYMNYSSQGVKTNRWGFWNSLGAEAFGNAADEDLRPWFFPTSLLSRFFPNGCTILKISLPEGKTGLYGIAARKNNKYTIALVNTNAEEYTFDLKLYGGKLCEGMNFYKYIAQNRRNFIGQTNPETGFPEAFSQADVDLSQGKSVELTMEANSFLLLTNMD